MNNDKALMKVDCQAPLFQAEKIMKGISLKFLQKAFTNTPVGDAICKHSYKLFAKMIQAYLTIIVIQNLTSLLYW
jgi:hypothetical protein